jgi:hypothetical protein
MPLNTACCCCAVAVAVAVAAAAAACRLPPWSWLHHRDGQNGQWHPRQRNSVPGVLPGQRFTWGALQYCEVHGMRGRQDNAAWHTQDDMRRCVAVVYMLVAMVADPGSVRCFVESVDSAASMSGNGSRCADSCKAA